MSTIERVLDRIKELLKELERDENISAKIVFDSDAKIIKIFGEGSDYLKRANSGLAEVSELAYTTAEHHPYWALLYHANEISRSVLEKWEHDLTLDQISEMSWRCDEIKSALARLPNS